MEFDDIIALRNSKERIFEEFLNLDLSSFNDNYDLIVDGYSRTLNSVPIKLAIYYEAYCKNLVEMAFVVISLNTVRNISISTNLYGHFPSALVNQEHSLKENPLIIN